jgi:tetratricopeptide (TPR) repeat protein
MVHKTQTISTIISFWRAYHESLVTGDVQQGLRLASRAVRWHTEAGDLRHAGIWQRAVANTLLLAGKYPESIKEARRAVRLQPDTYEKALGHILLGQVLTNAGRLRAALRNFALAAEHGDRYRDDTYLWSHLYGSRALTFCASGKVDKAIVDWEGAAQLMLEAGYLFRAALFVNSIGYELAKLGALDEAEQRLLEALELVEREPHAYAEACICDSLGYAYTEMRRFKEAERFLRKSAKSFAATSDRPQLAGTLLHLSLLHHKTGCYETAREEAFRALELATEVESESLRTEARDSLKGILLGQMQESLGEWFEAHRRLTSPVRLLKRAEPEGRPTRNR